MHSAVVEARGDCVQEHPRKHLALRRHFSFSTHPKPTNSRFFEALLLMNSYSFRGQVQWGEKNNKKNKNKKTLLRSEMVLG